MKWHYVSLTKLFELSLFYGVDYHKDKKNEAVYFPFVSRIAYPKLKGLNSNNYTWKNVLCQKADATLRKHFLWSNNQRPLYFYCVWLLEYIWALRILNLGQCFCIVFTYCCRHIFDVEWTSSKLHIWAYRLVNCVR